MKRSLDFVDTGCRNIFYFHDQPHVHASGTPLNPASASESPSTSQAISGNPPNHNSPQVPSPDHPKPFHQLLRPKPCSGISKYAIIPKHHIHLLCTKTIRCTALAKSAKQRRTIQNLIHFVISPVYVTPMRKDWPKVQSY